MGETHARGAGHIHQFNPTQILKFNVTHTINKLSFGESLRMADTSGGSSYNTRGPLDGLVQAPAEGAGVYMYYVKVIPTVFSRPGSPAVVNGQRQNVLPGIFFVYDVSPFMIRLTASYTPLISVLTNLCAILGGVIAAATLVDQVLYKMTKAAKGMGKNEGPVPAGGAQGALVDALAGAVTQAAQVAKAGVQYAGSPAAQYGYIQAPTRPSFGSGSTTYQPGSSAGQGGPHAGGSPATPFSTGSNVGSGYGPAGGMVSHPSQSPQTTGSTGAEDLMYGGSTVGWAGGSGLGQMGGPGAYDASMGGSKRA
jgi:hypothetical protein